MFFNKSAQEGKNGVNPFISSLADYYLDYSLKNLDETKVKETIKGKFASIKYTLSGFDPSELPYKDKIKLISVLYDINIKEKGAVEAKMVLERAGLQIKERLGADASFDKGLADLPEGLFEVYRLKGLSKEQLEKKLEKLLFEFNQAKFAVEGGAIEQTTELVAERDVLEAILYNASDGVFSLDRAGNIITFNKAMEKLIGFTFEEVENKSADEYIRLFDASVPLETKMYCSRPGVPSSQAAFSKEKLTLVGRNGGKKYVKMISATIPEGREVNIGCIVTLVDITKDIDLETMKLDFVSIAAHELRTPLTAMRGYLDLLNEETQGKLSERHTEYLGRSVVSADRLHVLIENLLNVSRIEKGTLSLDISKQDWVVIVKQQVEELKASAESAGLKLSYIEAKEEIPKVYIDATTIVEVLSNLLDNAIRYTKAGGRITVFVETTEDSVVTHVRDTGIGIPQASLPHIFKKFYRVSTTVLRAGEKGTGLGLFISKAIVSMHKGKIWAESEKGKGSTFSFSLPTTPPKKGKKT